MVSSVSSSSSVSPASKQLSPEAEDCLNYWLTRFASDYPPNGGLSPLTIQKKAREYLDLYWEDAAHKVLSRDVLCVFIARLLPDRLILKDLQHSPEAAGSATPNRNGRWCAACMRVRVVSDLAQNPDMPLDGLVQAICGDQFAQKKRETLNYALRVQKAIRTNTTISITAQRWRVQADLYARAPELACLEALPE